jgi:UTP pyrophosphatase
MAVSSVSARYGVNSLKYLTGYPEQIQLQAGELLTSGRLGDYLERKYPHQHQIQNDKALYGYINDLKSRYLRKSPPLSQVRYDSKLNVLKHALGMHTYQSRVQGSKLKAHNSITVAALFKEAPPEFLRMIVVHELAHFKEKDHNKAFYQLCCHMESGYHQLELDTRLWLQWREREM